MWYTEGQLVVSARACPFAGNKWRACWSVFEKREGGRLATYDNGLDEKEYESPMEAAELGARLGVQAARRAQNNMALACEDYLGPYPFSPFGAD